MNEAFKLFKSKTSAPDLSRVIDCSGPENDKVTSAPVKKIKEISRNNFSSISDNISKNSRDKFTKNWINTGGSMGNL